MANEVGVAYVSILPSLRGFSRNIRNALKRELAGLPDSVESIQVKADVDTSQVVAETAAAKEAAEKVAGVIDLDLRINRNRGDDAYVGQLGDQITKLRNKFLDTDKAMRGLTATVPRLSAAFRGLSVSIGSAGREDRKLRDSFSQTFRAFRNNSRDLRNDSMSFTNLTAASISALGQSGTLLGRVFAGVGETFKDLFSGGARLFSNFGDQASQAATTVTEAFKSLGRVGSSLFDVFASVGSAVGPAIGGFVQLGAQIGAMVLGVGLMTIGFVAFGGLAAGAIALVGAAIQVILTQVGALVVAVGSLVALLAAISPAALLGLGAAAAVAYIGFKDLGGVLKAFVTGDLKGLDEAVSKLPRPLRAVGEAIKSLVKPLRGMKEEIQTALFRGLDKDIRALADHTLPGLRRGLVQVAGGLNNFFSEVTKSLASPQVARSLETILTNFGKFLTVIGRGAGDFIEGIAKIGEVASPFLVRIGENLSDLALRFANWVDRVSADGRLQGWLETAYRISGDLLETIGNLAEAFLNVAKAIPTEEIGDFWTEMSQGLEDWTKSREGRETLDAFFSNLDDAKEALKPVIDALKRLYLEGISPLIDKVSGPAGKALAAFLDVITGIIGNATFKGGLADFFDGIRGFFQAFKDNGWDDDLGRKIGELLRAIGDLLKDKNFQESVKNVADAFLAIAAGIVAFGRAAASWGQTIKEFLKGLGSGLAGLGDLITGSGILGLGSSSAGTGGGGGFDFSGIARKIGEAVDQGIRHLQRLSTDGVIALGTFTSSTVSAIQGWATSFGFSIASGVLNGISSIASFRTQAGASIGAWAYNTVSSVTGTMATFAARVATGVGQAASTLGSLPGRVSGALASFVSQMTQQGANAVAGLHSAISRGLGTAVGVVRSLGHQLIVNIQGIVARFTSIGTNAVQGLINGMQGLVKTAIGVAAGLGTKIVSGLAGAIGARSPSIYAHAIGEYLVIGLYQGIEAMEASAVRSATRVADNVMAPFRALSPQVNAGLDVGSSIHSAMSEWTMYVDSYRLATAVNKSQAKVRGL